MTRVLLLTNGWFALVDDEDYAGLAGYDWVYDAGYATRHDPDGAPGYRRVSMHRQILNAPKGVSVDHINGDRLDNRRINLRQCSHSQNTKNQKRRVTNTTGFKGVSKGRAGRFRACIVVDGKSIEIGRFANPIHAAIAYDEAAKVHHGEFARLNFDPTRDWLLIGKGADEGFRPRLTDSRRP